MDANGRHQAAAVPDHLDEDGTSDWQHFASLVTSWLIDIDETIEPPPLAPTTVAMIGREPRARAH